MRRHSLPIALAALAIVCQPDLAAARRARLPKPAPDWQVVAKPDDRSRLHLWHVAWGDGLRQARGRDGGAIAAAGALFDADAALADPAPPAGLYRCRTYRLGVQHAGDAAFSIVPAQSCRIAASRLIVLDGMQRPAGRLFADNPTRLIFLGAMALGDEPRALDYGRDDVRDMAGFIERIEPARWRLVLPRPRWQSQLDVIEIVPAAD